MKQDMIVILDLGCTENTATARAIRALGVYSEIYPHDVTPEELAALPNVKGVILNGGPNRVVDGVSIDAAPEIYACGLPVLAVCHPAAQAHTDRAQVFVRKVAPLGAPVEVTVRGYELSLRKADAEMIEVQ